MPWNPDMSGLDRSGGNDEGGGMKDENITIHPSGFILHPC
jgi:hypothetical protein